MSQEQRKGLNPVAIVNQIELGRTVPGLLADPASVTGAVRCEHPIM
jgi:hypothetical protein